MPKDSKDYYFKKSSFLGWGERSATLDGERLKLIDKYVAGKKILDIGFGAGVYVDYLVSKGFDAYGLDFVDQFIKEAKKSKKGIFIKGEAEKLPFQDNEFDTTILFNVLEHGDDEKVLKEAKRVAKKRILVIVPKEVDRRLEQAGVIFRHYLDKSHLREYRKEDLENLAKNLGLKLTVIQPVHPLHNETIFLSLFSGPLIFKKIIRKIVFAILPKENYPTEYFAVFDKN